jgi:cytochrome c biogenesis protein CcmG/thiol:disulfide interchange protein DsbE
MPWFSDLHQKYSDKGLVVLGVSMDDEGWKVVKPFTASADIPYTIVLGSDEAMKEYKLEALPGTFLIDREGRISASYRGLVDRGDIESNIATMLRQ